MAMFQEQTSDAGSSDEGTIDELAGSASTSAGDPVAVAAVGSVLLSWYKFYIQGDEEGGIFVGLWAPTLLAAASYLQQKDLITRFRRGISSF
jgi:hypothetical protein